MVRVDVRRDYYAELGLGPSAEADDVKKQFRKLALKYHPDRNPGKEQEFNAKFQAIQAAHEILSDPQQRLKYDTDRLRAGYDKVYGPPKPTPQRKQAQPTAPPRTQKPKPPTQPYSSSRTANGPSAGAQRYSAHARAGPQPWQKKQDEAQTRADAFKGFSGMRGSNPSSSTWQQFDPQTGRATPTPGAAPRQQNAPFGNNRQKSAYEYFKENVRAQAQNPPSPNSPKKRQGFAPGTAGGDEPPAANTSAYTNGRSERPSSMYFDSAPPPTAKKPPAVPEASRHSEDYERTSSRYAATGGEKTFFSSAGLGRSSTTRKPSGPWGGPRTNPPSPVNAEPNRHRSASPKVRRRPDISPPSSTTSSDMDSLDEEETMFGFNARRKPKAVPKSRLRPHQKFSDFHRGDNSSARTGRSSNYPDFQATDNRPPGTDHLRGFSNRSSPKQNTQDQPSGASEKLASGDLNGLHKKFSAEDWREHFEKFDFMGAAAAEKEASLRKSRQNRSAQQSRNESSESMGSGASSGSNNPGSSSSNTPQQASSQFPQAKFSADQWSEQLRTMSWNIPDSDKNRQPTNGQQSRSPKRPSRPTSKLRSNPQQPSVATEADEESSTVNEDYQIPQPQAQAQAQTQSRPQATHATPDVEPMDIDDEIPFEPAPPASTSVHEAEKKDTSYPDLNAHASTAKETQRPNLSESKKAKSEGQPPLFDFDKFHATAPFTNTNSGGIDNLADVHATLPFESRASRNSTGQIRPRKLDLPNPPKRPRIPTLIPAAPGSNHLVLRREEWRYYVSAMGTYMHDWNLFNKGMLHRFKARQEANETGLSPGWISAVGDSSRLKINGDDDPETEKSSAGNSKNIDEADELIPNEPKGGFSAYLRGIEEDNQMRKHWEVACEGHRDCILSLGRLREWIRNGGRVV